MSPRTIYRCLAVAVLLLACMLIFLRPAKAGVTCSATGGTLNFGSFDPQSGNQDFSATTSYTCSQTGWFLSLDENVTMCLSIGKGSSAQQSPREMSGGSGAPLQFDLYTQPSRAPASLWGSFASSSPPLQIHFVVPGAFLGYGTYSGQATVYGRVPGGQSGVTAGSYANVLSDSFITYRSATSGPPATCGTGNNGNFQLNVVATVQKTCTVTATDMNFGNAGLLDSAAHNATSSVGVKCVNGTAYHIGLDNGLHASGNTRRMQGPGGFIKYELYRNNARNQRWGTNLGIDTVNGTGNGSNQNRTVYGRVPSQTTPSAGTYRDTVTITVTY